MDRPNENPADTGPIPRASMAAGVLGADLAGDLARWATEARADDHARVRRAERNLREQAVQDATLVGVLLALAEQAATVTVDVASVSVTGRVVGLGTDFLAAVSAQGHRMLVPLRAVDGVTGTAATRHVAGLGSAPVDVDLASVIGPIAADRPTVLIRRRDCEPVRGTLRSAGRDVVMVWRAGDRREPVWIPLAAIEVLMLDV